MNAHRICSNLDECRKVAGAFFGDVGLPSLIFHFINQYNDVVGKYGADYYFIESSTYGFKGNTTTYTSNYDSQYLPEAQRIEYRDAHNYNLSKLN